MRGPWVVAQVLWGADQENWPSRWRRKLARIVHGGPRRGERCSEWWKRCKPCAHCPDNCPLHGRRDVRHQHFNLSISHHAPNANPRITFLGALERFGQLCEGEWVTQPSFQCENVTELSIKLGLGMDAAERLWDQSGIDHVNGDWST